MADYKHPEVLVTTEWVAQNLNAPNTRLVEVDVTLLGTIRATSPALWVGTGKRSSKIISAAT